MAYSLYTKNERGEIVAVTPGIDERVSNLETKAVETDLYKLDVREQTLTTEQKTQVAKNLNDVFVSVLAQTLTEEQKTQIVQNLVGTFLPLSGGSLTGGIEFQSGRINIPSAEEIVFGANTSAGIYGGYMSCKTVDSSSDPGSVAVCTKKTGGSFGPRLECLNSGSLQWNSYPVARVLMLQQFTFQLAANTGTSKTITLPKSVNTSKYHPFVNWGGGNGFATVGYSVTSKTTTNFTVSLFADGVATDTITATVIVLEFL